LTLVRRCTYDARNRWRSRFATFDVNYLKGVP
jgi:hypothetical protein